MKKSFIVLVIILISSITTIIRGQEIKAKSNKEKEKEFDYRIEIVFTGEVTDELDSVFKQTLIISKETQKQLKRIEVKKQGGSFEIDPVEYEKSKKIRNIGDELYIDLGRVNPNDPVKEIYIVDPKGERMKGKYKK